MLPAGTRELAQTYYNLTFQGLTEPEALSKRISKWTSSTDGRDKICKWIAALFTVAIDCLASAQLITYSRELLAGVKALRSGNSLFNGPEKAAYLYGNIKSLYDENKEFSADEAQAHRLALYAGIVSLTAFMVMFVVFRPISVFQKYTSIPYFPMITPKNALKGFMVAATVNHLATVIQHGAKVRETKKRHVRLKTEGSDEYYVTVAPSYAKMVEKTGDLGRDAIYFGLFAANWYLTTGLLLTTAALSVWGTYAKTCTAA